MKGIHGKILRVDLTGRECRADSLPDDLWRNWLGGRGVGTRLLMDETSPGVEPLSADSKLYFMLSPLVGTLTPGVSKTALVFKSPLTGGVFISLCGGDLGAAIRHAGWDGIVIEGRSEVPVIVSVDDGRASVEDAGPLWGMEISGAEKALKESKGEEVETVLAGPAGERLVRFASLHSGRGREFGRGGAGAVFGAKNLKGVAIKGGGGVTVADPKRLEQLTKDAYKRLAGNEKAQIRRKFGTLELVETINQLGFWPTRNFSEGHFEGGDIIDAHAFERNAYVGHRSCFSCPVRCGKIVRYKNPDGKWIEIEGPEFESLSLLGPNLGIGDIESISEAARLCDELGMDTIGMGNVLGAVFEAAERGVLPDDLAEGMELGFGKTEAAFEMIRRAAMRDGELGWLMGEGSRAFARSIECEELAMDVKGLGLPAYDPRGIKGLGLNYATAAAGANHMRGPTMPAEIGKNLRLDNGDKAAMVIDVQVNMAIADSTCLCSTARGGINVPQLAEFLETVTGDKFTADDLSRIGKNIITLERKANLREGFTEADDTLPKRMLTETFSKGASKGHVVELDNMKLEYYRLMGWDDKGVPED